MSGRAIIAAAALAGLGAPAAQACSPDIRSFREQMREAPLAVRAKARFTFTHSSSERLAGTAVLDVRECLKRDRKLAPRCPRRVVVQFDEGMDGINCPPEIIQGTYKAHKLNFFLLWRDDKGGWQIGVASRQLDR